MEHEELSPEAHNALLRCYQLLYQLGHEAQAEETRSESEQSTDAAPHKALPLGQQVAAITGGAE